MVVFIPHVCDVFSLHTPSLMTCASGRCLKTEIGAFVLTALLFWSGWVNAACIWSQGVTYSSLQGTIHKNAVTVHSWPATPHCGMQQDSLPLRAVIVFTAFCLRRTWRYKQNTSTSNGLTAWMGKLEAGWLKRFRVTEVISGSLIVRGAWLILASIYAFSIARCNVLLVWTAVK